MKDGEMGKGLGDLHVDKDRLDQLKPILDDWAVELGSETEAVAEAYREYARVWDGQEAGLPLAERLDGVSARFEQLERRSYHPYIRFQRARIFEAFRSKVAHKDPIRSRLDEEIEKAYQDAYFMVNLKYQRVAESESYAVFLWFYGSHLTRTKKTDHAIEVLEEAIGCFQDLVTLRNISNAARCSLQLAYARCLAYIYMENSENPNPELLEKAKAAVYEARSLYTASTFRPTENEQKAVLVILLFCDAELLPLPVETVTARLTEIGQYPGHLVPIVRKMGKREQSCKGVLRSVSS